MSAGPLSGIRIIEFDAIGPVPLAATILADYGCDVVRVRREGRPPRTSADGILGRGRRCVTLDLKSPRDRDLAQQLIAHADALLEGHRPGVMERLGLGPAACLRINSRLVYGRMTGWGQTGPLVQAVGHDINYIALTGALHAIGEPAAPLPPLNLVGDYGGGSMMLALGVTAALLSARSTGCGQVVDAAMTDGSAMLMSLFYAMHAAAGWSDKRGENILDGGAPFYRTYRCSDGKHVAVGAIEPEFFTHLLTGLGLDPSGFEQGDRRTWPEMARLFAKRFAERTRDDWATRFEAVDACVTPVLSLSEAPDHPHNRARQTFAAPLGVTQPMPAPRFSNTPPAVRPAEESDVDRILAEWEPVSRPT